MKRLNLVLFSLFICGFAFANSPYAVITGKIGHRAICPEMPCLTVDYIIVTNDTASFYLVKDGQMLISVTQLGNEYSYGDMITIYGAVSKKTDYDNREYYELRIISIYKNGIITGKIDSRQTPHPVGVPRPHVVTSVIQITNDTTSFVLLKNGNMIRNLQELGDYSAGDMIFIYGSYFKSDYLGTDYIGGNDFYFLEVTAILHPSNQFSASCTDIRAPNQLFIQSSNNFVTIDYVTSTQCAPAFALKVSDIVNDILYVNLTDTAAEMTTCMCNFTVFISLEKPTSQTLRKVYFNGVFYDINPTTNIEQINIGQIQILPNPTNGQITIGGIENFDNTTFELYDLKGSLIQSGELKSSIDLSAQKGIYLLTITQNRKIIAQERVVIK
jgi:hypothetical protein